MSKATVSMPGGGRTWQVELNPAGTVIGRNSSCDVVIDSAQVSRRHAKVSRTPANRWTITDLGSSNGTFVNGTRVESCPIQEGDVVEIGPVSLSLGDTPQPQHIAPASPQMPKIIVEDFGTEVFYDKPRIEECATQPCPDRLAELTRNLSQVADLDTAYKQVCRVLARVPKTAAVVFRMPRKDRPMPETPEVRASHFGSSPADTEVPGSIGEHPSHHGFRVSHRLLEAVRTQGRPLMTKSIFSCDNEITTSFIDEHSPRALICAPLASGEESVDLVYVDVPIDEHIRPGPEEMFAFVQAVARQVREAAP